MAAIIVLESLKSTTTKPNAPQASSTPSGPFDNLGVIIGIVTGCMIAIMILVPIIAGLCDITENHRKDRKARKLTANNNDGGESGRGGIELRRRDVEIQGRDEDRVEEQGEDDVTEEDIDFTEEDIEVIEGRYAELPARRNTLTCHSNLRTWARYLSSSSLSIVPLRLKSAQIVENTTADLTIAKKKGRFPSKLLNRIGTSSWPELSQLCKVP